ncbi:hypothetical protein Nepgr_033649 [Nepenthes gracilis]|uniref:Uncharacterized protein n=1 Tax=Nepenthes gracilis TaxID=150966 RepID=A0AAD3TKT9_NEPGR|nr:hypothetical protein Nepgr_033649 [Nepenthes gracilis]
MATKNNKKGTPHQQATLHLRRQTIQDPNAASALMQDCINRGKKATACNIRIQRQPATKQDSRILDIAPIPQLTSHGYQANWNIHLQRKASMVNKTTTTCRTKLHANQP